MTRFTITERNKLILQDLLFVIQEQYYFTRKSVLSEYFKNKNLYLHLSNYYNKRISTETDHLLFLSFKHH